MSFGDGSQGALGLPTLVTSIGGDAYEPTPVRGLPSDMASVSAGHYNALAVTSGGKVWAWGRNNEAQLGRDVRTPSKSEATDAKLAPMPLAMPCLVPWHGGGSVARHEHRAKGRLSNSSEPPYLTTKKRKPCPRSGRF